MQQCRFLSPQQTTVEEQSRIAQLEEELSLSRAEIQKLQARLAGGDAVPGSDGLTENLLRENHKEGGEVKEKLAAGQQEIESLKAVVDKQNQEIGDLKQKVQQATKENMDMDTWKVTRIFLIQHNVFKNF